MVRAASLLASLKSKNLPLEDLARAAWPQAAGKRVAARTRAVGLVRQTLVIEVEDAVWRQQLTSLRGQLLTNIERVMGPGVVDTIEFRVAALRRPPQREEIQAIPAVPQDEADRIADPVLRRIYRQSRARSGA
jgi:hypothetical protein